MACNEASLTAFMACNTQWRVTSMQTGLIWIGLDYAACDVALRHLNVPAHVFGDLRVIEEAVLPILNGAEA